MTSEGLGEMFEGDSADTCARKFSLTSMGAKWRVSHAQTRERGPHPRERNFVGYIYLRFAELTVVQLFVCPLISYKKHNGKF